MSSLVTLVNLLQGTASERDYSTGNTLPIAARPFGLHHWALQTARPPWFFHPAHRKLWGIRLTHQPSPWMGDYGSVLLSAFRGPAREEIAHQASAYRLREARLDGFCVELLRYGIACEMSPSERGASFVFTAQDGDPLKIRLDFDGQHEVRAGAGERTFGGESRDHTFGVPEGFGLYFHGEFDAVPAAYTPLPAGGYWTFPPEVRRLEVRFGASFIDEDIARLTVARELAGRSLDAVRDEGAHIWEGLLGRIEIEPENDRQQRTFYSCLSRCLLFPRFLDELDASGRTVHFSPYDGRVHAGTLCTDNGFWDTHRTVYPLLALAYPDQLTKILGGWLNACRQSGWSPKWPSPGQRDCMIGTHFDAVVADAVARGVTDWDVEAAFRYLWRDATVPSNDGVYGRQGLEDYIQLGYLPADRHAYSVSATLDYAYDDFCVAQVARFLGRREEEQILRPRAGHYRNVFDPAVGFMRERLADGSWRTPFREFAWGGGFIEGGPWQHTFNVPHDPEGLAALLGGRHALCRKLDAMLARPPTFEADAYGFEIHEMTEMALAGFGQYAHSNQPVHGFLFLYALMGEPEKTVSWVRRVAEELYSPDGFPGDEDNGEMSAWYVLASLGRFPPCPGKSADVTFRPLVRSARVHPSTVADPLLITR